jgi:class 3 adenylate cyclase/pimeloyl-ACP methyl ester carboxylesterase
MQPPTRYAKTDEGSIAFQAFGEGPLDLVFITNWATNVDAMWEEPSQARFFERLAGFARVLVFDKRGTGVSDPVPLAALPTLEQWIDDARVVMDPVGSERAAVIGDTEGGPMALLFAATHPERVSGLVLLNTFARLLRAEDFPIGMPASVAEQLVGEYEAAWGTGDMLALIAPSVADDPRFRAWFGRYQRLSMPPGAATALYRWVQQVDVRAVLGSIQAETLVIHRQDNTYYRVAQGRYLAEHIPGAELIELPGADCYPFHVGDAESVLGAVERYLTGARDDGWHDRVLATVVFTDIVDSTRRAAELGDRRWLDLRSAHEATVRELIGRNRGREIDTTGDGFLATFDGPARAVRFATAAVRAMRELGLEIRVGMHTGEIELRDGSAAGIAVHIAARVMAEAEPGTVFSSGTVRDLTVGSGLAFAERGVRTLKGVPGSWPLFEVTGERSNA